MIPDAQRLRPSMFNLTEQNIIVRGHLNPAIFQPQWLVKVGLIPPKETIKVNWEIGAGRPTEFIWENNFSWVINDTFLKVNAPVGNPPKELGKFVSGIFDKLEHTPISGTGHNFLFEGEAIGKLDPSFLCKENLGLEKTTPWGMVSRLKHEIRIERDEISEINIYFQKSSLKSNFQLNFHYEVSSANQVVNYSKKIEDNLEISKEILKTFLK